MSEQDTREHMDNGVSVHMCPNDSREQLEADMEQLEWDAKMLVDNLRFYGFHYADDPKQEIIELLNRQAAITWCVMDATWKAQHRKIAELTAEVEAQHKRANEAERGVLDGRWYISRDEHEDDIAELTAERDELKAEISKYEHDCRLLFDEKHKLTAERNELRLRNAELEAELDEWKHEHDTLIGAYKELLKRYHSLLFKYKLNKTY